MEKIKKFIHLKNLESDIILRIVAVIIAIAIWVVLSITQYPTTTLKISNIPVIFNIEGTIAEEKGLRAVGYQNVTTTVEIKGMKYEIGGYTEKDLIASVNLDTVTKEGTYSLSIEAKSAHSSDQCEILSCYPETINVTFEHFGEQTFSIETDAPNISTENDAIITKAGVSPNEITVTGSDENLKKIKRVVAELNDEKTLSEDTTISTSDIVFYDENGNMLSSTNYTVDNQNFDITFSLFKKSNVKLNVDFENCPPNFNISSLPYSLSPEKVSIIDSELKNTITAKTVGKISLSQVDLNKTFEFDIPLEKTENMYKSSDSVKVTFDSDGYTKRTFDISMNDINIINTPSGKNVKINSPSNFEAIIYGPESIVTNLTAEDITAEIDLDKTTKTGTIDKTISVYSKKYNSVWCFGDHKATITISD